MTGPSDKAIFRADSTHVGDHRELGADGPLPLLRAISLVAAVAALLASAGLTPPAGASTRFASHVEDLPLMDGLTETGEGFPFETPQGRIVRIVAEGRVNASEVGRFYAETLPALGWRRAGDGLVFTRAGETLEIETSGRGPLEVVFTLRPGAD